MELISWQEVVLVAVEYAYSWAVKKYSSLKTGYIPWINFGAAAITHFIAALQAGMELKQAILQGIYKGFLTMIAVTGLHSAAKNGVLELAKSNAGEPQEVSK